MDAIISRAISYIQSSYDAKFDEKQEQNFQQIIKGWMTEHITRATAIMSLHRRKTLMIEDLKFLPFEVGLKKEAIPPATLKQLIKEFTDARLSKEFIEKFTDGFNGFIREIIYLNLDFKHYQEFVNFRLIKPQYMKEENFRLEISEGFQKKNKEELDNFILMTASALMIIAKQINVNKTLSHTDIMTAARILFHENIAEKCIQEADKTMVILTSENHPDSQKKKDGGIVLPHRFNKTSIVRFIKQIHEDRVGVGAVIYLGTFLSYISSVLSSYDGTIQQAIENIPGYDELSIKIHHIM